MSLVEEREKATLRQCVQARCQLEEAIGGVTRAEVQLKDNSREVSQKTLLQPLAPPRNDTVLVAQEEPPLGQSLCSGYVRTYIGLYALNKVVFKDLGQAPWLVTPGLRKTDTLGTVIISIPQSEPWLYCMS